MTTTGRKLPENTSIIIPRLFCHDPAADVASTLVGDDCTLMLEALADRPPASDAERFDEVA